MGYRSLECSVIELAEPLLVVGCEDRSRATLQAREFGSDAGVHAAESMTAGLSSRASAASASVRGPVATDPRLIANTSGGPCSAARGRRDFDDRPPDHRLDCGRLPSTGSAISLPPGASFYLPTPLSRRSRDHRIRNGPSPCPSRASQCSQRGPGTALPPLIRSGVASSDAANRAVRWNP